MQNHGNNCGLLIIYYSKSGHMIFYNHRSPPRSILSCPVSCLKAGDGRGFLPLCWCSAAFRSGWAARRKRPSGTTPPPSWSTKPAVFLSPSCCCPAPCRWRSTPLCSSGLSTSPNPFLSTTPSVCPAAGASRLTICSPGFTQTSWSGYYCILRQDSLV